MSETEIVLKLLIACLLGGFLGFFREKEKKAAGLRTHMLVCLGAALFTLVSIYFEKTFPGTDAARIASNIVVGIGFIGAGTIIQNTGGSISGITTAASIWVAAALGMAIGVGFYFAAGVAAFLAILAIYFMHGIEIKYIRSGKNE